MQAHPIVACFSPLLNYQQELRFQACSRRPREMGGAARETGLSSKANMGAAVHLGQCQAVIAHPSICQSWYSILNYQQLALYLRLN